MLVASKMPIRIGNVRVPVDFLEIDHLLIVDLADDDPGQFHRDGHGGDPFRQVEQRRQPHSL